MKVLHITNAVGKMNAGGIGDVLTAFVKHQRKLVDYIEVWHPNEKSDSEEFASATGLDIQQIHSFKTVGGDKIGFSPEMISRARRNNTSFDIVHQHGIWLPVSLATLRFNAKQTKKVISPHGFLNENALSISSKKKKLVAALFENKNLKTADCIHACSDLERDFVRDYSLNQPIALIPNGVEQDFLEAKGNPQTFKHKHGLEGKRILFFLSRIHPSKGLALLINVLAQLKSELDNWVLVIAGIDELNHEQELKELTKRLQLGEFVKFIGPTFGQDKIDAFDAGDIFVLPTDTENFGIVITQALARKRPAICTTFAPWSDLKKYNCGWWIEKTENSFLENLRKIMKLDATELNEMGMNGYRLVLEKYLWKAATDRSVKTYEWLLSSGEKPDFIFE